METWHVYQLRSDTELLYVGYTRFLKRRLSQHRRNKPWWPEVTDVGAEEFGTEDEARQREKDLWAAGQPKHNRRSPFRTAEEGRACALANVKRWKLAHPEKDREYWQARMAKPGKREANRARIRESQLRNRPTTRAGRAAGRWRQTGPGLF